MKTKIVLFAASLVALQMPSFSADSTVSASPESRVEVIYSDLEKFRDFTDSDVHRERGSRDYAAVLKEYLEVEAAKMIPQGTKLTLTFTNIDMAGEFEPWRGPRFNGIRIVKDTYPPRVDLAFKLTDANGDVLREGTQQLRDINFQMNMAPKISNDALRHEKALIEDWLRAEFAKEKKTK